MMNKKNFVRFALLIKELSESGRNMDKHAAEQAARIVNEANGNQSFDRRRFMAACGLQGNQL